MSRSTWACELKCKFLQLNRSKRVTLHVSVWVEICIVSLIIFYQKSRSTWACELKWNKLCEVQISATVTLHVSVWVEMKVNFFHASLNQSRSTWACELKFVKNFTKISNTPSRSTWACELKLHLTSWILNKPRHAPRERVSWNTRHHWWTDNELVTLHVSVWVEIPKPISAKYGQYVTLHVSVWVEMTTWKNLPTFSASHAPRERVSWNIKSVISLSVFAVTLHVSVWVEIEYYSSAGTRGMSRSTWACELKFTVCTSEINLRGHAPRERVSWN